MWAARQHLEQHRIKFQPGVNEDLAATSVWGSQMVNMYEGATADGVFGICSRNLWMDETDLGNVKVINPKFLLKYDGKPRVRPRVANVGQRRASRRCVCRIE